MPQETKSKELKRKTLVFSLIGVVVGGIGGYIYYETIGKCSSGSCPITSNPWSTIGLSAIMGYLLFDIISSWIFKNKDSEKGKTISE